MWFAERRSGLFPCAFPWRECGILWNECAFSRNECGILQKAAGTGKSPSAAFLQNTWANGWIEMSLQWCCQILGIIAGTCFMGKPVRTK